MQMQVNVNVKEGARGVAKKNLFSPKNKKSV